MQSSAELAFLKQFSNRSVSDVWTNRACAISDQAGNLMHVPGFPGIANDAALHSFADPGEMMMHGSGGQQHRNRDVIVIDSSIRKNNQSR